MRIPHRYKNPVSLNDFPLADWITAPRADRGVRFADDADGWRFVSYPELAELCLRAADQLSAAGAAQDGRVCVVMNTSETSIAAFCATLLIGATVAPVAPPTHTISGDYAGYLGRILGAARPDAVVAEERFTLGVKGALAAAGLDVPVVTVDATAPVPTDIRRAHPEYALLQFTSGSTKAARSAAHRATMSWHSSG